MIFFCSARHSAMAAKMESLLLMASLPLSDGMVNATTRSTSAMSLSACALKSVARLRDSSRRSFGLTLLEVVGDVLQRPVTAIHLILNQADGRRSVIAC
jgi:hypothetical protein